MRFVPRLILGMFSGAGAVLLTWAAWVYRLPDGQPSYPLLGMAAFCAVITLACFHAGSRPITLRLIGATILLVSGIILVVGIVERDPKILLRAGAWLVFTGPVSWRLLRYAGLPPVEPAGEEFDFDNERDEYEDGEYSTDGEDEEE